MVYCSAEVSPEDLIKSDTIMDWPRPNRACERTRIRASYVVIRRKVLLLIIWIFLVVLKDILEVLEYLLKVHNVVCTPWKFSARDQPR